MKTGSICGLLLLLLATGARAEAVELQASFEGRVLNAAWNQASGSKQEAVLVLHGTFAHHRMEIVQAIQQGLAERNLPSLAPTLSLGISSRGGFLPCSDGMNPDEATVQGEIAFWLSWLEKHGYQTVTLLGHSRGALQAAQHVLRHHPRIVTRLVLLGPLIWRDEEVAARFDASGSTSLAQLIASAKRDTSQTLGPLQFLACTSVRIQGSTLLGYYDPAEVRHVPDLVPDLRIRTEIVLGSDDAVAAWNAAEVAAARERLNVRVHVIEGADHFFPDLFLEEALDAVLVPAVDLSGADPGQVQLLFIALSDCPICLRLEKEVLYPLLRSRELEGRAKVTQLLLDDPRPITDFEGKPTTASALADFHSSRMSPSLLFLDAGGIPLRPSITGYNNVEYFSARLERAVGEAAGALGD